MLVEGKKLGGSRSLEEFKIPKLALQENKEIKLD